MEGGSEGGARGLLGETQGDEFLGHRGGKGREEGEVGEREELGGFRGEFGGGFEGEFAFQGEVKERVLEGERRFFGSLRIH